MEKSFYVYITANKRNGTLYIGVTSCLLARIWQHKNHVTKGFTQKYNVCMLVYYECHDTAEYAFSREKKLKKWRREWKISLIESFNPEWKDLYLKLQG